MAKTAFKSTLFLVFSILIVACNSKAPISEKKMESILYDILILESANQIKYNGGLLPRQKWKTDMVTLAKKNEVDTAEIVKTLIYYDKNPSKFANVMEKVITKLQQKQLGLDKQK